MEFRIANTFTDALARLSAQDQKAVKNSVYDLQVDPSAPGLQFHRIEKSKDQNFWSVRVSRDLRIIVHKTDGGILLAYVDHHDEAYAWAERRRIAAHPKTGAVQIVEVRELVEHVPSAAAWRAPVQPEAPLPAAVFAGLNGDQLLSVGVPPDWTTDILSADEDRFLAIAEHLPGEASEALLEYVSTGQLPLPRDTHIAASIEAHPTHGLDKKPAFQRPQWQPSGFDHPDAQRRFRLIESADDLRLALDYPWDKWLVYLHPSQREAIDRNYSGPARVSGSAGTGKTVVAIHRAVRLARSDPHARVLLTTFSQPLANILAYKLKLLTGDDASIASRITVAAFHRVAEQLFELSFGHRPYIISQDAVRGLLAKAAKAQAKEDIGQRFLASEWSNVVDAWQIASEADYAAVPRLGRKNRMGAKQRAHLWPLFDAVRSSIAKTGATTWAQVLHALTAVYAAKVEKPFSHVVVDEAQDLGIAELRFLAALAPNTPNALFFAGDLGQRIFQQPFSWLALGVEIRGRSQTLKVNYRTSHQIREIADKLLPKAIRDVDGVEERRDRTMSAFNGPEPEVARFKTPELEIDWVSQWLKSRLAEGVHPAEMGVFVRDVEQLDRARAAIRAAGLETLVLSDRDEAPGERVAVGVMQLAKGLEYRVVVVMACDADVLPLQARIATVADEIELDDVYETERQLLYVACTRARDRLLVTGVEPVSEFLADFG